MSDEDKFTGKKNQITITCVEYRLSKEDIELIVNDAKKYERRTTSCSVSVSMPTMGLMTCATRSKTK